ncbi:hypothetical protein, partial [Mammaliicoccus sciuri]|uniref:hypothetical protein n=1 Tax=Mammaliicoccus sciuri TaxID=1296 RepID=UPI001A7E0C9C
HYTSPFIQLYKAKNTLQSILQEINLNLPINTSRNQSKPTNKSLFSIFKSHIYTKKPHTKPLASTIAL